MSRNNNKPDHGKAYVPGAEQAPDRAPQPLDHFKRGYHERANLRERETDELVASGERSSVIPMDSQSLADALCRPGCHIHQELDQVRNASTGTFDLERALTAILSTLARRRRVGIALAVWDWMDAAGMEKNSFHYNSMISVCEKTKDQRRAMQLFEEMERKGIPKNEVTFSSTISACEKAGQWRDALRLLNQMKAEGVGQTAIAYNAAISACEKGLVPHKALEVFDQMKQEGVEPTVVTYSALISAAEKGQQWKLALRVLDEMRAAGHGPNVIAYSAAISALSKGQQWKLALDLFRELESSGNTPSIVTYNATMTALEKGLQWERALDLFDEMKSKGLAVTVVSYGSAISACEKGHQFRQCLAYLDEMSQAGIKKNVIIFGAAMSCMEKCGRADIAFQLMERMKIEGVVPNVHIYNSAISACARCNLWEKGFELFNEMEEVGVPRDVVTYNAALDAVASQVPLARKLFLDGVERGFYARVSRLGTQWLELDLHFLSLGGGEIALRWWFDDCLVPYLNNSSKLAAVQSIDIVTGYGKTRTRGARHSGDSMRERVKAMLRFMNIKEIEGQNKGRIHIDKACLEAEVEKQGGKIVFDEEGYNKFRKEELAALAAPEVEQVVRPSNPPQRVGEIRPRNNRDRHQDRNKGGGRGPPGRRFGDWSRGYDSRGTSRNSSGRFESTRRPSDGYRGGYEDRQRDGDSRNDRYSEPYGRQDRGSRGDDRSYRGGRGDMGNGRNEFAGRGGGRGSYGGRSDEGGSYVGRDDDRGRHSGDRYQKDYQQDHRRQSPAQEHERGSLPDQAARQRPRDIEQVDNRGGDNKRSFETYRGSNARRGYDLGPEQQDRKRQAR